MRDAVLHDEREMRSSVSVFGTGISTPRILEMEMHFEWMSEGMYEHAKRILDRADKKVCVSSWQDGMIELYILSESQEDGNAVEALTVSRINQHNRTIEGQHPTGVFDFQHVCKYSFCMHRVIQRSEQEKSTSANVCTDGNPLDLKCIGCAGYQHCGICGHIIAATHLYYAHLFLDDPERAPEAPRHARRFNVRYMLSKLYGSTGRRSNHRSTNNRGPLTRDMDLEEGSSDEDQDTNVYRDCWD